MSNAIGAGAFTPKRVSCSHLSKPENRRPNKPVKSYHAGPISDFGLLSGFGFVTTPVCQQSQRYSHLPALTAVLSSPTLIPASKLVLVIALAHATLGLGFEAAPNVHKTNSSDVATELETQIRPLNAPNPIHELRGNIARPLIGVFIGVDHSRTDDAG